MASAWLPSPQNACWPSPTLKAAILDAWRLGAAAVLTARKGFRGGTLLDCVGTRQLLFSSCLRVRDKMLLRRILCGGVWNGILLGKSTEGDVPCQYCGRLDGDGHLFWDCQFSPPPPWCESGRILSFQHCGLAIVLIRHVSLPGILGGCSC